VIAAPELTTTTTLVEAFRILALPEIHQAISRARSLKRDPNPDAFHKLRIALRRLRSLWWAYEPLLDKKDAESRRDEFKGLADAAGKTRDWDVLRELLTMNKRAHASFGGLVKPIDEHRVHTLAYSRAAIGNADIEQILENALDQAIKQLASASALPRLDEFARARIESAEKKLGKRVKRAAKTHHEDYATLHQVRIAGKKVRYLLEFFSPVLDGSHHPTIRKLASVQDELGDLNDLVTCESLIRHYEFPPGTEVLLTEVLKWLQHEKRRSRDGAYVHLRHL
jgi:CHAD domain-containing protein